MSSQKEKEQGMSGGKKRMRLEPEQQHVAALGGRYSLQCVRGRGSFAEVWEATHRRTAVRVAIKILCPAKLLAAGIPIRKVKREIAVMRLLRHHPHVVRFYEAIRTDRHVYIVMELAESGQLHDHVAIQGRLPEPQARAIFQQLVSGAAYCHHNMVVHRDLKMENVLLDSHHNVKIVDFGFSKLFVRDKFLTKSCGSPEYAAPELHERQKYIGPQVDVWSCGVILYGMLCGTLPFNGADISDLRRNVLRGEFRMPSFVSDDARDLISGMLIVKPAKRMHMAEVMAHRWLQPGLMAPYLLAMPPLDANTQQTTTSSFMPLVQQRRVVVVDDGTVVEQLDGFERSSLLRDLRDGVENEATVAYNLILCKMFDAPTRYLWTMSTRRHRRQGQEEEAAAAESEMQLQERNGGSSRRRQWALGGLDALHECPRETMRHVARALRELGILYYPTSSSSSSSHRHHRMLCAHLPVAGAGVIPRAAIIRNFRRLAANANGNNDALRMNDDNTVLESLSAAVFFEIQLYRAGEGGTHTNYYVLDIKRISGPQIPYLHICSQLASMLRPAIH